MIPNSAHMCAPHWVHSMKFALVGLALFFERKKSNYNVLVQSCQCHGSILKIKLRVSDLVLMNNEWEKNCMNILTSAAVNNIIIYPWYVFHVSSINQENVNHDFELIYANSPHSVETVIWSVDCKNGGACISFCDATIPFKNDHFRPNFVVNLCPFVENFLNVFLKEKKGKIVKFFYENK